MTIYRDFNHWWREGNHGYSSASREDAEEIWKDLEPTILASRDDYKNAFVELMNEHNKRRADLTDALLEYIEKFMPPTAPGFWRWYLDSEVKREGG